MLLVFSFHVAGGICRVPALPYSLLVESCFDGLRVRSLNPVVRWLDVATPSVAVARASSSIQWSVPQSGGSLAVPPVPRWLVRVRVRQGGLVCRVL